MKKLLLILTTLVLTGLSGPAFAQANEGWYGGVSVGSSEVDDACTGIIPAGVTCDDSDTGFKLFFGKQATKNWGGEFGFVDLGEASASGLGVTVAVEADGFFAAGTGTVPLGQNERFALFGKLGVILWGVTAESSVAGLGSAFFSEDGISPMFGLGFKYDFTERVEIRAEWEKFDLGDKSTRGEADVDLFTVGVVVWFGPKSANAGSGKPTSSGKPLRCKGWGCPE